MQIGYFLAAALYFLSIRRPRAAFFASIAAIAFKFSAIASGLLPLLAGALLILRANFRRGFPLLLAAGTVFFSWFAMNVARFGNPLFPYIFQHSPILPDALERLFPKIFTCMSQTPCWDGFYIQNIEDLRVKAGFGIAGLSSVWMSWTDLECLPYEEYLARWGPGFALFGSAALAGSLLLGLCRVRWQINRWQRPRTIYTLACTCCLWLTIKPQEARLVIFAFPFFFAAGMWWLQLTLRAVRLSPVLRRTFYCVAIAAIAWTAAHAISRQSRLLNFWISDFSESNGVGALLFSMPSPGSSLLHELALTAQNECSAIPLFIDFKFGLSHSYGFAPAAVYAFVRRDWKLATQSVPDSNRESFLQAEGAKCLVIFSGSSLKQHLTAPRWHRLAGNELGEVFRADAN